MREEVDDGMGGRRVMGDGSPVMVGKRGVIIRPLESFKYCPIKMRLL